MVNDPIGDMLIQIKNASMAGKKTIELPYSRIKHELGTILSKEGYVTGVEKIGDAPKFRLKVHIKYQNKERAVTDVKRKSKPGLRVYVKKDGIPRVLGGNGIAILSTPQGLMTGKEAQKLGIGGEFLCEVW